MSDVRQFPPPKAAGITTPEGAQWIPRGAAIAAWRCPFVPLGSRHCQPLNIDPSLPHWTAANDRLR